LIKAALTYAIREKTVRISRHLGILLLSLSWFPIGPSLASEEPQGLLLRRGLVGWQVTLQNARAFVEENVRPKTLRLLRDQKEEGFRCEKERVPGVLHCVWACCVDLGEKEIFHFATLWFYDDRFYAYDVVFNTGEFPSLFSILQARFGKPTKEEQTSQMAPNFALRGLGMSTYIVNTRRWDIGNVVVLLSDRGGEGKPLAGHIYVAYMPLLRATIPQKKEDTGSGAKLPF
jgi:hypothetical protein